MIKEIILTIIFWALAIAGSIGLFFMLAFSMFMIIE